MNRTGPENDESEFMRMLSCNQVGATRIPFLTLEMVLKGYESHIPKLFQIEVDFHRPS